MSLIKLFRKNRRKYLFTTPSHGQKFCIFSKFLQFYKFDISETETHKPEEALIQAENKASEIYNTVRTKFLINGATSGIIISVLACVKEDEKVLIWKDSHKSHKNAVRLARAVPIFYEIEKDENWGIEKPLNINDIENKLKNDNIKALIITSPTYEGVAADIKVIKTLCKKYGTYLIADEAHGALYPFSEELPESAVRYADFTVQSLHKTAAGLNPTALLHSTCDLDFQEAFESVTTTSPSYPLLTSIEANINFLNSNRGRKKIAELIKNIKYLKKNCVNCEFFEGDVTKIVVKIKGINSFELSKRLFNEFNIEDEKTNEISTMLLCGLGTDIKKIQKLEHALKKISEKIEP